MTSKKSGVSDELRAQYSQWCRPRRGSANPENMTNDVWIWLIKDGGWPGPAHDYFGSGERKTPGWCFSRYGQSETKLPDGSIVYIGGEHEDFYDPDFYIYNDVIVKSPDGSITIYGYPTDVFPPTDSHTASLVDDQIFIVGCIGYAEQRMRGTTPVFVLDTKSFSIRSFETNGTAPSWLFKHSAELSIGGHTMLFKDGKVGHAESARSLENIALWSLCLKTGFWDCLAEKPWTRWMFAREDDSANDLKAIGYLESAERSGRFSKLAKLYQEEFSQKNFQPDFELYSKRFAPPVAFEEMPKSKYDYRTQRISIDGVTVRYFEGSHEICVTVEGSLPSTTISALKYHGLEILSALEEVPYKIIEL